MISRGGNKLDTQATDVLLVAMPYTAIQHPSIALGILSVTCRQREMNCQTLHANLLFAKHLGIREYQVINGSSPAILFGEWTFAHEAFPNRPPQAPLEFVSNLLRRHVSCSLIIPMG
jgi:hypothetical protein